MTLRLPSPQPRTLSPAPFSSAVGLHRPGASVLIPLFCRATSVCEIRHPLFQKASAEGEECSWGGGAGYDQDLSFRWRRDHRRCGRRGSPRTWGSPPSPGASPPVSGPASPHRPLRRDRVCFPNGLLIDGFSLFFSGFCSLPDFSGDQLIVDMDVPWSVVGSHWGGHVLAGQKASLSLVPVDRVRPIGVLSVLANDNTRKLGLRMRIGSILVLWSFCWSFYKQLHALFMS